MGADKAVSARWVILSLFVVPMLLRAVTTNSFEDANKFYEQGKFAEAAAAYEQIAASGTATANVWFNLGNANYKSGQLGRAIGAYRMAERMTPRDAALRANLQFVRGKVYSDERAHIPFWKNSIRLLTLNEWTMLGVAFTWAFFSVLACGAFAGRRYPKAAATFLALALVIGAATAVSWKDWRHSEAVVTAREATVHFGPLQESQAAFQLRDGAELTVLGTKNDWIEIRDPEGRSGWIRRDDIALLR
jgi:tetratricopeptide (TPR) repeat protein